MLNGRKNTVFVTPDLLALSVHAGDSRRPHLYPSPGKGHYHHQFGGDRKGLAREPLQELFRPSLPRHRKFASPLSISFHWTNATIHGRCGREFSTVFLEYGDTWRLHRRFFHQTFRSEAVHRFVPLQHRKSCQLLRRLLDSPDRFSEHIFEYVFTQCRLE